VIGRRLGGIDMVGYIPVAGLSCQPESWSAARKLVCSRLKLVTVCCDNYAQDNDESYNRYGDYSTLR
jgi:hypothetical protein